jgi:aryl-alcohol dehydrogenase-like predicted oxidoreductase
MIYRTFGKTGWDISTIVLGTWNIGNQWGDVDDVTAWATVRKAFDCGVNLFDVAESYGVPNGLSEERLGGALAGIRHHVFIVSKIGHWGKRTGQGVPKTTVDMIRLCAHASLHRLQTDWIDVELCHEGNIEDPSVYLEAFEMLKERGRIRAYGISTDSLEVLKRFNANGTCSVVQVNYSMLNRAPEGDFLDYCKAEKIAVMVRGPLRRGLLSGKYTRASVFTDDVRQSWNEGCNQRAQFEAEIAKVEKLKEKFAPGTEMVNAALRYVISPPADPVAIPGAKSPEQAAMNAAVGDKTFSAEELAEIQDILA